MTKEDRLREGELISLPNIYQTKYQAAQSAVNKIAQTG